MPKLSADSARPPGDFASLLATKEPVILVGGQAVNVWALYYHQHTVGLGPFVSFDVEILGGRETLEHLARLAGSKPQFFPLRPPSNEIGVVQAQDSTGRPLLIEVLRYVHGITNEELLEPSYTLALGPVHVRVPSPIALLQAKIANVSDIDQTDRRDRKHVHILTHLMPAYLGELQQQTVAHILSERKLLVLLERLLAVLKCKSAKEVFNQLKLERRKLFEGL